MTRISANTRGTPADKPHTNVQETHRTGYVYSIRDASRPLPPISIRAGGLGEKQNPVLRLDAATTEALDARLEGSPERYQRGKVLEVAS